MRKSEGSVHGIINYLGAMALTVGFALFLSGRTGWFLFAVMIMLPVISVITALVMRRYISVSAEIDDTELYKGSSAQLKITVKNSAYIPSPPVKVYLSNSDSLKCAIPSAFFMTTVNPRSEYTVTVEYTAEIWSASSAGAKGLSVCDYTGMIELPLKNDISECRFPVKIIPNIIDVPSSADLLKTVNDAAAHNDDSEETLDSRAIGFTGTPGFEHREYVPGDPIKRINWKLSGKRDKLMIRLDDQISSSKHTVILDSFDSSDSSLCRECCGENMLGMLMAIVRTGFEADAWYYTKNGWQCTEISDEANVEQLRLSLGGYSFSGAPNRIPTEEISAHSRKGCSSLMFFTPKYDADLAAQLEIGEAASKTDATVTAAAASVDKSVNSMGVWLLSPDGSAECLR